jgi:glycosyltransferase involved in cell wall biosynthesis
MQDAILKFYIYGGHTSTTEYENWETSGDYKGVKYEYIYSKIVEGYWKVRWNNYVGLHTQKPKLYKILISKLKDEKGIVWTDTSQFGFELAYRLKKQYPSVKIFTEISEFLDIQQYNKGNFLQRWVEARRQKYFEQKAFYAYDGIALMTKTLLKYFKSFISPHPKFIHLPMTVDLDRFNGNIAPLPEYQKPYIAFVGVMNDAKDGVNILIQAFFSIKDKYPDLKLYLVGAWNYDTPGHLKMIEDLGLQDKVFWMKEYPRDQIPNIICLADLLVLPRPDSKQAQGGFPTKLGEYLATGNPVCATRVGELSDYLKDNESVFFAEPGSVDSFAEAMRKALSDPENARRVGANGRIIAEREFNKELQAKTLHYFIKAL